MKLFLFIFLFISLGYATPDISKVRIDYRKAANSEEASKKLFEELSSVTKNNEVVLVAYKGAVTTMMSKYAEGISDKKSFFKEGRDLLEHAIADEPENVEIRCIRLSVQENVPRITGYRKNIDDDKRFILENFNTMTDADAKAFVKGYASQSDAFTDAEKQLF